MEKGGNREDLNLFLEDLQLDGIDLSNLSCNLPNHKVEHCDSCRFFNHCPYPKKGI